MKYLILIAAVSILYCPSSSVAQWKKTKLNSNESLPVLPSWTAESNQAAAKFGCSVSTAGDVNGDGYADVIVTAAYYDDGETDEGKVFVYYGSPTGLSLTPNWTAESNQAYADCYSGASAGDVNGDGYDDVIVGAQLYDNGETDEGRAYVYYGSPTGLSLTPNWITESNQAGAQYGICVASAGDVNGDGYADVIVGSYLYDDGETDEGKAFVYYGSANGLSLTPNWTAESNQAYSYFGICVASAGDVNGDGYSDVIIGAHYFDNGQTDEGRAFVYYGSASGLSLTANWTAENNQANSYFGYSVSSAGDVNGDGYSDVIIGAYLYDNGETDEGRAYVYLGSSTGLSSSPIWTAESNQANSRFGNCVGSAGDVNGDGYSDVIVGAYRYSNGQTEEGSAFVYYGSPGGVSPVPNWTGESDQAFARYGYFVSGAGDVNGDGYGDIIVGAVNYDNGELDEGRVMAYYGYENKILNLTLLIQGFYNAGSDSMIRDTVRIYLRSSIPPYEIIDSSKTYLSASGSGTFTFSNSNNNTPYYITTHHRNSIETWSDSAKRFTHSAIDYNFTSASSRAFGNNMIQVNTLPVRFAIYNGDVNQDGSVNLTDIILIYNDASTFITGYNASDLSGDNATNLTDIILSFNNSVNFVSKIRP